MSSNKLYKYLKMTRKDCVNKPAIILVEELECFIQILFPIEFVSMHCCSDELDIVDCSIFINISLIMIDHKNSKYV